MLVTMDLKDAPAMACHCRPLAAELPGFGIGHRFDEADDDAKVADDLAQEIVGDYLTGVLWSRLGTTPTLASKS